MRFHLIQLDADQEKWSKAEVELTQPNQIGNGDLFAMYLDQLHLLEFGHGTGKRFQGEVKQRSDHELAGSLAGSQ